MGWLKTTDFDLIMLLSDCELFVYSVDPSFFIGSLKNPNPGFVSENMMDFSSVELLFFNHQEQFEKKKTKKFKDDLEIHCHQFLRILGRFPVLSVQGIGTVAIHQEIRASQAMPARKEGSTDERDRGTVFNFRKCHLYLESEVSKFHKWFPQSGETSPHS